MARQKKENEYSMVNGIRKTKSGSYQASVYVGMSDERDPKTGKLKGKYEYITRDTYAECKQAKIALEKDIAEGKYTGLENCIFSEYATRWLNSIGNSVESTTLRDYTMYINKHLKPVFGKHKLKDISEFEVKEYINSKLKSAKNPHGLSPTTVRKHFFTLSQMLYSALKYKNPCSDIAPPQPADYVPYVPTDEEWEMIRATVKGTFDEPIVMLAGLCGLREGEIFALKPNDINETERTIKIDESMAIDLEGKYHDKDPKSRNGKRTLVVDGDLLEVLKVIKNERERQVELLNTKDKPNVIVNMKLFNMRPDSYARRFAKIIEYHNKLFDIRKKFGEEAIQKFLKFHGPDSIAKNLKIQKKKLPDITFHTLRHFHTTVMYENDIPDHYAAERLGDNIKTVKQVYQHLRLKKKTELDDKIRGLIK